MIYDIRSKFFIENHAFVILVDVSNARFFTFTSKHVARPVEL